MKITKTLTILIGCLLIGNFGFAAPVNSDSGTDSLLSKGTPFEQQTKYAVLSGTVLDRVNSNTIVIVRNNRAVAGSVKGYVPKVGEEVHATGTYEGTITVNQRKLPHYRLTRVVTH